MVHGLTKLVYALKPADLFESSLVAMKPTLHPLNTITI